MNDFSIGIIGHFGGNKNFTDGQTVKTKELYNYLLDNTNFLITKFDTYNIKINPFKKFIDLYRLFKKVDVVILIVSSRGYKILVPIIDFLNRKRNVRLYDFVIGGNRQKIFENNSSLLKKAYKYKKIYVETKKMLLDYEKLGFHNVEIMNNFKNITSYSPKKHNNHNVIKLCTFSRVCKEKGISDSIKVVKKLNDCDENKQYVLDIYGKIDDNYMAEFNSLLNENSKFVSYCGVADFSISSKIISNYDLLLFLTFWPGEGMPGTIIDCFFASTPVVATDWNYNFEILKDKCTGIKVEVGNVDQVVKEILVLVNNSTL